MTSERFIKFSTRVKAPAPAVFAALTSPTELTKWFPSKAVSDLRPGGKYTYTFVNKANPSAPTEKAGEFNEVVPNKKVSYSWPVDGDAALTTVEFTLTDLGGETEVALAHTGFGDGPESDAPYDSHTHGWTVFMTNIKTVLERGEDQRELLMGMLVI